MRVETQTHRDEMQKGITEHRANAEADKRGHELFIHVGVETRDEHNAHERRDGDDERGQEAEAVDLRQRLRGASFSGIGNAGRRQGLLQQRRTYSG